MDKKIIFCDIDGTIVDSRLGVMVPSEKTVAAFQELRKNHEVYICSGRTKTLLEPFILDLPVNGYVLANGGLAEIDGKYIGKHAFTDREGDAIRGYILQNGGMYLFEHAEYLDIADRNNREFRNFYEFWGPLKYADIREEDLGDECYVAICGFEDMSGVEAFVKTFGKDFDVKPHRGIPSLDINPKGISKATGMEDILTYLGKKREDTIAFGDASNDLEMIEYAGLGIAMGNASEDVKKRADRVCGSVDEDGFYYACVELGLIDDLFTKNVIS